MGGSDRERIAATRRVTWVGMGVSGLLALTKFVTGGLGGSHAVFADGVHSLSDMATDLAVILGVSYWTAPPDRAHPYGHRRIETLVTAFIGLVLIAAAVGLGYNALAAVHRQDLPAPGWIAGIGALLSILSKEVLFRWTGRVGKRLGSGALLANAWHHRSDAISSVPALLAAGIAAYNPAWAFVDRIGAVVVSLFVIKVAWDIMRPTLDELTERGATEETLRRIREIAGNTRSVKEVHAIRTRRAGGGYYVDLHILVNGGMSIREGHAISERVAQRLLSEGPDLVDVVVHLEPFDEGERKGGSGEPDNGGA